jgi:hypothetical protein
VTDQTLETVDTGERSITLPSGNTVSLREWGSLTRGDKRTVLAAVHGATNNASTLLDITSGLLHLLVTGWTYNLPLPSVASGSLDMLPWADDSVLQAELAGMRNVLFPGATEQPEIPPDGATVNLPSGAWVKLRDWRQLNRGDKRTVLAHIDPDMFGFDLNTGLLALLIDNWSYTLPKPSSDPATLLAIPWADDAVLAAALTTVRRALFPPQPATAEQQQVQEQDPTSPTTGAGE